MLIPLVLIVFIVMAILGVTLMFSGTSEYSQSALAGYGLKAEQIAMAAVEEARGVVYDQINRPGEDPPPWKQELYDSLVQKAESQDPSSLVSPKDLLGEGLLPLATQVASDAGGVLVSATVDFHGFRQTGYLSASESLKPSDYYLNADGLDPPDPELPREYLGLFTLQIEARYGAVTRRITTSHDIKVVLTLPFARQFALFSMLSTDSGADQGPSGGTYARNDLNQGGAFNVYGNRQGRVFVRGPFFIETAGWPRGTGGERPRLGGRTVSSFPGGKWYGWSDIPTIRDLILKRDLIFIGVDPARPDRTSRSRLALGIPVVGGFLNGLLNDDAGFYGAQPGQSYYAAFRDAGPVADRTFSLFGDPRNNQFNMFRGVVTKHQDGNRLVQNIDVRNVIGNNFQIGGPPGDDDDKWVIEPEGNLIGVYQVVTYRYRKYSIGFIVSVDYEKYNLDSGQPTAGRYGLHWEKKQEQSIWASLLGNVISIGTGLLVGLTLGVDVFSTIGLDPLMTAAGALTSPGWGLVGVTVGATIVNNLLTSNPFSGVTGVSASSTERAFPSHFRITGRMITRYYPRLAALPSVVNNEPLILDGVTGFEDLSCPLGFGYIGKGVLFSDNPIPPTIMAPISPLQSPEAKDSLFIHYGGPVDGADTGSSMLRVDVAGGGPTGTLISSIFSTQGVRPAAGRTITVGGNLTCGFVNKAQIPTNSRLAVNYDKDRLAEADPATYNDGSWHVISVSHKIAGCSVTGGG